MITTKKIIIAGAAGILLLLYQKCPYAQTKPQDTRGIETALLQQFTLAAQIPTMDGYELRGRRIAIAPGEAIAEHSHSDRPGIVYILEGTLTEYRNGAKRVFKAGDTWAEDISAIHRIENTTDKAAVIWAVGLIKKQ
jgi:quercetin dioxygenase-like cupin family protein